MSFEPLIHYVGVSEVKKFVYTPIPLPSDSIPGPIPSLKTQSLRILPLSMSPHEPYNASNWPRYTEFFLLAAFRFTRALISKTLIPSMTWLQTWPAIRALGRVFYSYSSGRDA